MYTRPFRILTIQYMLGVWNQMFFNIGIKRVDCCYRLRLENRCSQREITYMFVKYCFEGKNVAFLLPSSYLFIFLGAQCVIILESPECLRFQLTSARRSG